MEFGMEEAFRLIGPVSGHPIVANPVAATDGSRSDAKPEPFFFHSDDSVLESLLDNRESSRSAAADAGALRTATADSGHRHGAINWSGIRTLTPSQKLGSDRRTRPDDRSRIGLRRSDRPVADDHYIAPLPHPGRHHPGRVRRCLLSCGQIRRPGDLVSLPACERATVSAQAHPMVNAVGLHVEKFADADYVATSASPAPGRREWSRTATEHPDQRGTEKMLKTVSTEFSTQESFCFPRPTGRDFHNNQRS